MRESRCSSSRYVTLPHDSPKSVVVTSEFSANGWWQKAIVAGSCTRLETRTFTPQFGLCGPYTWTERAYN